MDVDGGGNKRVFHRLGGPQSDPSKNQKVCFHWRAGKCNRHPCPFLHRELPPPPSQQGLNGTASSKRHHAFAATTDGPSARNRGPNNFNGGASSTWGRTGGTRVFVRKMEKVCNYWVQGNCSYGDKCKFLHCWSMGDSFSLLTQLDGHQKVIRLYISGCHCFYGVTLVYFWPFIGLYVLSTDVVSCVFREQVVSGIALPSGSDKLYTGSKDQTVRVWDCQSGQVVIHFWATPIFNSMFGS